MAYALPALPMASLYFPVYVFLAPFYAETVGVSLGALGAVLIAIRLLDGITDPMMGWISDRFPTRFGRRKPWLALATPVIIGSAWALFSPPEGAGIVWFSVSLTVLTLSWTMFLTPYFAWGAEMTGDYADRSRITVVRESIGLMGTIVAALLFGFASDDRAGMGNLALFLAIALPAAVLLALIGMAEPRNYSREPIELRSLFGAIRREPLFIRLLTAYFINGAANALPASLFLFYVNVRLEADGWGEPLIAVYFLTAALAAPFWIWASGRFAKHRVWCWAMVYSTLIFLCVLPLGPGDVLLYAIIVVASGAALGADLSLPTSIQADVVDVDLQRSGQQRTGGFFALWSVATKAAVGLTSGLALVLLQVVGFSAVEPNTPGALWTLTVLYAALPIALKAIAIALMWTWPLDRAAQEALRAEIEAR
ncbi:MAG: MFS transporter [Pseudomonadota bacterium]